MQDIIISIQGNRPLAGRVAVSGAKNAALPELAAACLSSEPIEFTNVPLVEDVKVMFAALRQIGAEGEIDGPCGGDSVEARRDGLQGHSIRVAMPVLRSALVAHTVTRTTRASVLLLGPILARCGEARVSMPGGCAIGERKIDFHLLGLQRMGAEIRSEGEYLDARCRRLRGIDFTFPGRTVTGTENLLMAGALAKGTTVLRNCAQEPEVADLAGLLIKMGADITREGADTYVIRGCTSLHGAAHRVIPDRIEAGTYLIAGCFAGNEVRVEGIVPEHLKSLLQVLDDMGADVAVSQSEFHARGGAPLRPTAVVTEPYPGFPTDLQAQLTALLTQADGVSRVRETIFNDRFRHVAELKRLGAAIEVQGDAAVIRGRSDLRGAVLRATDLRASAALVLGGLAAAGETRIENSYQLFRGYEAMPEKLQKLGAAITISRE